MSQPQSASVPHFVRIGLLLSLAWIALRNNVNAQPAEPAAYSARPTAHLDDVTDAESDDRRPHVQLGVITLNTLLQTRYDATFAHPSENPRPGFALREDNIVHDHDGYRLRRLYLRATAEPSRWFQSRVVLDFAKLDTGNLKKMVRQAWGKLSPVPERIEIAAGVVKLPFSLMKLASAARLEVADSGVAASLVTDLDFAGRDIGVRLQLAPFEQTKLLRLTLAAYRGHAHDEDASPFGTIAARVTTRPIKAIELGASVVHHPYDHRYKKPFETSDKDELPSPPDPMFPREKSWASGSAWGADVTFKKKRLIARAEGMYGDRVDVDERYGARAFFSAFGLLAYRFNAGPIQLQPAARVEYLDADVEHPVGARRTYSLAMNVIFSEHVRFIVDATHVDVDASTPVLDAPKPLSEIPYFDLDHTRAIGQLQIEI
jgi:hypothetical protein